MKISSYSASLSRRQSLMVVIPSHSNTHVIAMSFHKQAVRTDWHHVFEERQMSKVIALAKEKVDEAGLKFPKQVLMATEKVLTTVLELPDTDIKLNDEQIQNMLQWELEPLVAQRIMINRFGMEMANEGLLTMDQVREVLLRQQELKENAQLQGMPSGDYRFGQVAMGMGFLKPTQLSQFLENYDKDISSDLPLHMSWQVMQERGSKSEDNGGRVTLVASAIPSMIIEKWKKDFQQEDMQLIGMCSSCHLVAKALLDDYPHQQKSSVTTQQTRYQLHMEKGKPDNILQQPMVALQADHVSRLHEVGVGQGMVALDLAGEQAGLNYPSKLGGQAEFKHLDGLEFSALIEHATRLAAIELWGIDNQWLACLCSESKSKPMLSQNVLVMAMLLLAAVFLVGCVEYYIHQAKGIANQNLEKATEALGEKEMQRRENSEIESRLKSMQEELDQLDQDHLVLKQRLAFGEYRESHYRNVLKLLSVIKDAVNEHEVVLDFVGHQQPGFAVRGWSLEEIKGRRLIQDLAEAAQDNGFKIHQTSISHQPDGRLGQNSHAIEIQFERMSDSLKGEEQPEDKEQAHARMVER